VVSLLLELQVVVQAFLAPRGLLVLRALRVLRGLLALRALLALLVLRDPRALRALMHLALDPKGLALKCQSLKCQPLIFLRLAADISISW
jgi:hypothetical protein